LTPTWFKRNCFNTKTNKLIRALRGKKDCRRDGETGELAGYRQMLCYDSHAFYCVNIASHSGTEALNKAPRFVEEIEENLVATTACHIGKREILLPGH
jgi:hypothetical protein